MRPYSPGGALNALAPARTGTKPPTPSAHRLRLGLPGYLILFAPPAFVPQRQYRSSEPPSPPAFLLISTHFTATQEFRSPLPYSSSAVSNAFSPMKSEISHLTHETAYAPFTPSKSEQRLPPLYYRGCWHRVSRGFLSRYYHFKMLLTPCSLFPHDSSLQPEGRHPARGVASSRFRALRMILDCSLP